MKENFKNNQPWSKSEEKKLIRMKRSGHSNKEISEALGRSPRAVQIRLKVLGKV